MKTTDFELLSNWYDPWVYLCALIVVLAALLCVCLRPRHVFEIGSLDAVRPLWRPRDAKKED